MWAENNCRIIFKTYALENKRFYQYARCAMICAEKNDQHHLSRICALLKQISGELYNGSTWAIS